MNSVQLKEPKKKKHWREICDRLDMRPYPVSLMALPEYLGTHKIQAKYNGNNVIINNYDHMLIVYKMGSFGKGTFSRGAPMHKLEKELAERLGNAFVNYSDSDSVDGEGNENFSGSSDNGKSHDNLAESCDNDSTDVQKDLSGLSGECSALPGTSKQTTHGDTFLVPEAKCHLASFGESTALSSKSINESKSTLESSNVCPSSAADISENVCSDSTSIDKKHSIEEAVKIQTGNIEMPVPKEEYWKDSAKEPVEEPAKKPIEESAKKTIEESEKECDEESAKEPNEKSSEEPNDESMKKPDEESVKKPDEEFAKESNEESAKELYEESAKELDDESTKEPDEESAREIDEESAKELDEESAKESDESMKEFDESVKELDESTKEFDESVKEHDESMKEPGDETVKKRVKKSSKEKREKFVRDTMKRLEEEFMKQFAGEVYEESEEESMEDFEMEEETLELNLEEAYFLTFGLGCLKIVDLFGKELNLQETWDLFCESQDDFIQKYVVYHYFRSKGWVVKSGLKFGGDFLLYKYGPIMTHASYIVIIEVVTEQGVFSDSHQPPTSWIQLMKYNRIAEASGKEILLCRVVWPQDILVKGLNSPNIIKQFTIKEVLIRRWIPSEEREVDDK